MKKLRLAAVKDEDEPGVVAPTPGPDPEPALVPVPDPEPAAPPKGRVKTRQGKKALTIFLSEDEHAQLRMLGFKKKKVQQLGEEAIALLFQSYQLNR